MCYHVAIQRGASGNSRALRPRKVIFGQLPALLSVSSPFEHSQRLVLLGGIFIHMGAALLSSGWERAGR